MNRLFKIPERDSSFECVIMYFRRANRSKKRKTLRRAKEVTKARKGVLPEFKRFVRLRVHFVDFVVIFLIFNCIHTSFYA